MNGEIFKARILIVDDDPTNIQIVTRHLEKGGFEDMTATTDPHEALELFRAGRFDLILMDLKMPGMTGRDLTAAIRAERPEDPVPILILSALGQRQMISFMISEAGGAQDYLVKPFEGTELLARTRNLLDVRLARRLLEENSRALEERVKARTFELERAQEQIKSSWEALAIALGRAGEYRDEETGAHTERIGLLSAEIARVLGWAAPQVEMLRLAAPLHDLGKVGIPDGILRKPGRLTESERVIMNRHAEIGAEILLSAPKAAAAPVIGMAAEVARAHHEKWNGGGYPNALAGETIPLAARIVAVADVWDALLSPRPYKRAWTLEAATAEIAREAGGHFDPRVVEAFRLALPRLIEIRRSHSDREA